MTTNSAVWQEIRRLLQQGLSIIPVRDKDEAGGAAKTAYKDWKKYQTQQILEAEIFHQLDTFNTNAIAIICGRISGNLEVIDIDVKHQAGIDAEFFSAIREIYPNIWRILRIHKSPSGGYHILYKVMGQDIAGNTKLAERETTDEERLTSKTKKKAFIETRGEGGYVLAPPSMGYAIFQNNEIPIITWEDRCSLINLARSFDRMPKVEKERPKIKKDQDSIYDENPFVHFNRAADLLTLMEQLQWTFIKTKGNKIWLTKPAGKKNDVHGAIFIDNNLFYCFTTATDFEADKAYRPASIIYEFLCDSDWNKTYRYLVDRGYGRLKQQVERDIIVTGKPLPPNASVEAQQQQQAFTQQQQQVHPYGTFWLYDDDDKLYISREHLYTIAAALGFRLYNETDIYKLEPPFAYKKTMREFYNALKNYVHEEDGDLYTEICNIYESFLRHNGKFTIERLPLIKDEDLECDSRHICRKYFTGSYLEITKDSIKELPYSPEQKIIFSHRVQPREYKYGEAGVYKEFIQLAIGAIDDNIKNTIGFLAHEYKDETMAYIIVFVEKCADPKSGGGSGKNIFVNLFSNTTSIITRPGAGAKFDEKFFQSWNGERIFAISDVDATFNFSFLKEPAGGHMLWKRLFSNETTIDAARSPKLIVLTNFSYEVTDGGLRRRIIPIEFTDYFTQAGGVDAVFDDKHFPKDWNIDDWNGYDTFTAQCIQNWLRSKRKLKAAELSLTGWEKQFIQTHKITIWNIIQQYWNKWVASGSVTNEVFNNDLQQYFNENGILPTYRPSTSNIIKALQDYAVKQRVGFEGNCSVRNSFGQQDKGKKFTTHAADINKKIDSMQSAADLDAVKKAMGFEPIDGEAF